MFNVHKSHFKEINMNIYLLYIFIVQVILIQNVYPRSIDQLFADVEDQFQRELEEGVHGRTAKPAWYQYTLVNRSEELIKLQYDMIITKETWLDVINTTEELPQDRRQKRNAVLNPNKLWSRRIAYTILDGFTPHEKFLLLQAMNHWEEYTCLKFVEAKDTDRDVISFVPNTGTCESAVGRLEGSQPINLDRGCMFKEILVHEIGHALGFYHEHMRSNRDQYVTINYQNVQKDREFQFDPLVANDYNDYNKPYDYYSVMHYGKYFFSINRTADLITIEPKDKKYIDIIGNSPSLSFYDMKIANDLYKCSDGCPQDKCEDGFIGGSNCECFCQYGNPFDVRLCGTKAPCGDPNINMSLYLVFNTNYEEVIFEDDVTFPHRTRLLVNLKEFGNCDNFETNYTCNNGSWEGEMPFCGLAQGQARKSCVASFDTERYLLTYHGDPVVQGDEIPSDDMVNVSCRYKTPGVLDDNTFFCYNGKWEFDIKFIACEVQQVCEMVPNATITGTYEDGFKIECIDRHSIAASGKLPNRFTCTLSGRWEPFHPVCEPNNCTVPGIVGVGNITNSNGNILANGTVVVHGDGVILTCPATYVPDPTVYTCSYGFYKTPNGKIPTCVQVSCGAPPVKSTGYKPFKDKYLYGEYVRVKRCGGTLELIGKRKLQCTKHGNWSGEAECKPYCAKGVDTYTIKENSEFKRPAAGWSTTVPANTLQKCQKKCSAITSYLCRGVVFGYNGRSYECRVFPSPPSRLKANFAHAPFWTAAIRTCGTK